MAPLPGGMMIMDEALRVTNLEKYFKPQGFRHISKKTEPACALSEISFSLEEGKILGILGPNGAGKTTLLKIISTIILPDKGEVYVKGNQLGQDDNKIKSSIGFIGDSERSFYWRISGRQNLHFFAAMYGLTKQKAAQRIDEMVRFFQIDCPDKRFDACSTGVKRKFGLIRALLHDPPVLLLDEPIKSLDYNCADELKRFIREMAGSGKTIIFATHNMAEAEDLCDLFMILDSGRTRGFGSKQELQTQAGSSSASLAEIYLCLTQKAR